MWVSAIHLASRIALRDIFVYSDIDFSLGA